jgi:hypothetical protein
MTGQQLWEAACDGDAAKVSTLLSTQGAQSFINYQGALGYTPLHCAAGRGHEAVTEKLLAGRPLLNQCRLHETKNLKLREREACRSLPLRP